MWGRGRNVATKRKMHGAVRAVRKIKRKSKNAKCTNRGAPCTHAMAWRGVPRNPPCMSHACCPILSSFLSHSVCQSQPTTTTATPHHCHCPPCCRPMLFCHAMSCPERREMRDVCQGSASGGRGMEIGRRGAWQDGWRVVAWQGQGITSTVTTVTKNQHKARREGKGRQRAHTRQHGPCLQVPSPSCH